MIFFVGHLEDIMEEGSETTEFLEVRHFDDAPAQCPGGSVERRNF